MDAAHTYFNKTVLFLATALLMVVPGRAQTFNLASTGSNAAAVSLGNQATGVSVASSDGTTAIAFTTATTYTNQPNLSQGWLSVTGGSTTATTLSLAVANTSGMDAGVTYQATVTLTSTSPAITGTISVSYTFGSSSSGGTLTPSQTSVPFSAASGSSTSPQVPLANNTGNTVTLLLTTPTGGGSSSQIGVTFTVGTGGTGNLTASPNPISWSYTSGSGYYPASQSVTLTSASGAGYYTASVSPSNSWLLANNSATTTSGNNSSGPLTITIAPNPSLMSSLTSGATGYVYVTDSNNNPVTITVNLSVNGSGTATGITWSPNPVTMTAAVGGYTVQQTVYLTSTTAGTFNNTSISGSGLSIGPVTSTTNTTTGYVTVSGYSDSLAANTYYGSLVVYFTPTGGTQVSQTIPVSFVVGSGGGTTTPGIVTPTSLTFSYQTGTTATSQTLPAQNIVITGTGTFSVSAPTYPNPQPTNSWLTTAPSSTSGPATISVSASPTGLAANTTPYTATLVVTTAYGSATVTVSFLVTTGPVLVAYPGSLNFSYAAGGSPPYSPLYLSASDASNIAVTATTSATWLSVSGQSSTTTPTPVGVQGNNLTSLANGVYTGSVTVTATTAGSAANSPVNVPVVLTVTGSTATGGGGGLTLSSSSMTFNAQQNGTIPASQTLSVSASTSTNYTATASSTGNWLSLSPSGSLTTSANPILTASVNQSGLTVAGSPYAGTITLAANGVTQTVQVTLVVSSAATGGTGNVTPTPTSLNFGTYQIGGGTPSPQTLQVASASGSAGVSFTISSNAAWLSAGVVNGATLVTPMTFNVSVINPNVSTLAAGTTYNATITITPNGGTVVTVPVSLTVQAAPTVTVTSATTLSFSYQAGNANPTPGTVNISGGGASLGFSATVTSGSDWLSVSPTSGTTPATGTATLTVTVTPGNLVAAQYIGTILISGTGAGTGSTSINVNLAVTAPLPTINSVVNAASFIRGAISPGEIVTIFGTAIGPAAAAYATIDPSNGKLATTIGGVQVLFAGIPAPMIYAGSTQVSAIVPYEMAPISSPSVWIRYVGQTSNAFQLASATTMPGLFAQNTQGSGPGAILNQDFSVNGPGNPAAKGSIVMVFMTGEGATSPPSFTGKITTPSLPPPQVTPAPLLPVSVLINGYPALWTYAGEAPGLAAGLMQLNVQIPLNAASGPLSIQVYVGSNSSQNS